MLFENATEFMKQKEVVFCYLIIKFKEEVCMKHINATMLLPRWISKGAAKLYTRWIYLCPNYTGAAKALGRIIRLS